jgi:hypothetical protein
MIRVRKTDQRVDGSLCPVTNMSGSGLRHVHLPCASHPGVYDPRLEHDSSVETVDFAEVPVWNYLDPTPPIKSRLDARSI